MIAEQIGEASYRTAEAYIAETAACVGRKEGEGPLGQYFDVVWRDEGEAFSSFEKAEQALLAQTQDTALAKASRAWSDVDLVIGGDLMDQLIATDFEGRRHQRPLVGLFSACASFTEALAVGASTVGRKGPRTVLVAASSHHLTAERQFRFPLELGYQRTPTASWTATAAGAVLLVAEPTPVVVDAVTFGRVVDWGSKDANDMASAMAPAAVDTIQRHLDALGEAVEAYDAIVTGDLGVFGMKLAAHLAHTEYHFDLGTNLEDCGHLLYDIERQDVHNGGSGAGCAASVFSGYLYRHLRTGRWRRILLAATGALFSPTSSQQGESIPAIAHAVSFSRHGDSP